MTSYEDRLQARENRAMKPAVQAILRNRLQAFQDCRQHGCANPDERQKFLRCR